MSLYRQFKTDESIEKDGIWLEYGTEDGTEKPIRIKVARAGGSNTRYVRLLEIKTKPYRRQMANESMDPKIAEKILMEVFSECVVLGWENVTDEKDQPITFSKENCLKLFSDLPDLFADIREMASKASLYRVDIKEQEAKN